MPVEIEIVHGPDSGWRYLLVGRTVRVGSNVEDAVYLKDPIWGAGGLYFEQRPGGHQLRNGMTHQIYLNGKPVLSSQTVTVHDGALIQPTRDTLMKVRLVADNGNRGEGAVATPPTPVASSKWRTWAAAVLCVVAGAGYIVHQQGDSSRPAPLEIAAKLKGAIAEIATKDADARWSKIRDDLTDAVYCESIGNNSKAFMKYQQLRDNLDSFGGQVSVPESRERLSELYDFVIQRLSATSAG